MRLISRICALIGAAAFLITTSAVGPATAASKMKAKGGAVHVHGHMRLTKSGKLVHVHGYTRGGKKMVSVHGYTRKTKNGKMITVKGYKRSAANKKMHMSGAHM